MPKINFRKKRGVLEFSELGNNYSLNLSYKVALCDECEHGSRRRAEGERKRKGGGEREELVVEEDV